MNKMQVQSHVSPETYEQLQRYMTEQGLSEAKAIEGIVNSYFGDLSLDKLMGKITKIEEDMAFLKQHILAVRFRT